MPLITQNKESGPTLSKNKYSLPATIDREQLEYTTHTLLTYGTIVFFIVGTLASVAYMTVQQLKK